MTNNKEKIIINKAKIIETDYINPILSLYDTSGNAYFAHLGYSIEYGPKWVKSEIVSIIIEKDIDEAMDCLSHKGSFERENHRSFEGLIISQMRFESQMALLSVIERQVWTVLLWMTEPIDLDSIEDEVFKFSDATSRYMINAGIVRLLPSEKSDNT